MKKFLSINFFIFKRDVDTVDSLYPAYHLALIRGYEIVHFFGSYHIHSSKVCDAMRPMSDSLNENHSEIWFENCMEFSTIL